MAQRERRRVTVPLVLEAGTVDGENAANFTADFTTPIIIDGETEIMVKRVALDYPESVVVTAGEDDTMNIELYADSDTYGYIGTASVAPGAYTPGKLADAVQKALNNTNSDEDLNEGAPLMGSWRCIFDAVDTGTYNIAYEPASIVTPSNGDVVVDNGTYAAADPSAGGTFSSDSGSAATVIFKRPLATHVSYAVATVEAASAFEMALLNNPSDYTAGEIFKVVYDPSGAGSLTPYVRGVAGTPIAGVLPKSLLIISKHGNSVRLSHRAAAAAEDADFTNILTEDLLPTDGPVSVDALVLPQFYGAFATTKTDPAFTTMKMTADPFYNGVSIEVDGLQYEVNASKLKYHDSAIFAKLHGTTPHSVGALPPIPTRVDFGASFDDSDSIAPQLGFDPSDDIREPNGFVWPSTTTPTTSIDSDGVQTSLHITSTAIRTGSHFSSSAARDTAFILATVPVVAQYGKRSHVSYSDDFPVWRTISRADEQSLTTIDIQIRDSQMAVIELPTRGGTVSRSSIELYLRNALAG